MSNNRKIADIINSFSANLVPSANNTYSLGSSNAVWTDLYLSGNTITLGGTEISASDGTMSVNGSNVAVAGSTDFTTDSLVEGSANLYYTDARANSAMDAYLTSITANVDSVNGVTGVVVLDTGDIAENGNLYYTDARARTSVSVTTENPSGNGSLSYSNTTGIFTFTPADTSSIGGGGSSFTAVATGNISSGVTVALNSDGTVSAVTTSSTTTARSLSDLTYFTQSGVKYGPEAVYDTTNDRLVVFWRDTNNNDYLTCKVGTVSGNSISFGSAVVVETTGAATYYKAVFNSTEGVVVVSYGNNVKVGEVSGTSISFGSASSPFTSPVSDSNTVYISSSPSSGTLCFTSLSSTNNYAVIGTLSGTTLTLGSQQSQSLTASGVLSIFDSSDRLVFVYRNQAQSHYVYAQVCSISGTTITFGTGVQNNGYSNDRVDQLIYDTTNERIIAFCSGNSSQYKVIRPFTITGTYTLSWGTANQWDGNPTAAGQKAVYDPDRNIYLVTGRETNNYIRCWEISIATDSTVTQISNGGETDFHLDSSETHYLAVPVFNSNSGKMLIAYGDGTGSTNGTDGKVKIFTPTTTTSTSTNTSFIGISDAAILDTNSGTVTVKGGVASNLSGLTPSSTYYVQANGSLSTTSSSVFAGTALSATELLIGSTSSLADKTTTNLAEGDNLYYTNARARTSVSVSTASPSGNGSLSYNNTTGVFTFTPADTSAGGGSGGISNLVEDTTPQLGGNLDLNSNNITGTGNISFDGELTQGPASYYTKQYVLYGTTTDATETEILIGGSTRIPIATNTTVFYEVSIVARRTDATGESASWHLKGCADNFSGTVADVGGIYEISVAQDDANWAVDVQADDINNAIKVLVTGAANKTIRWTAIVKTVEVAS